MTDQPTTAAFDRTERAGSPGLVLLFAACLVGPIAAFSVLPKDQAGTMVIGLLTILAVIGIFALFGYAVGFFQFSGQAARNDLTRLICDSEPEAPSSPTMPARSFTPTKPICGSPVRAM